MQLQSDSEMTHLQHSLTAVRKWLWIDSATVQFHYGEKVISSSTAVRKWFWIKSPSAQFHWSEKVTLNRLSYKKWIKHAVFTVITLDLVKCLKRDIYRILQSFIDHQHCVLHVQVDSEVYSDIYMIMIEPYTKYRTINGIINKSLAAATRMQLNSKLAKQVSDDKIIIYT